MDTLEELEKELRAQKRVNQRQEMLAIAYGNSPDNIRAEALGILRELDKMDEYEFMVKAGKSVIKEIGNIMVEDDNLHPMENTAYNNLEKWYTTQRTTEFKYAVDEIYEALRDDKETKKAICRRIYKIFCRINARQYTNGGAPITPPTWKVFCEAMAAGYGVQLPYYRPAQLEK